MLTHGSSNRNLILFTPKLRNLKNDYYSIVLWVDSPPPTFNLGGSALSSSHPAFGITRVVSMAMASAEESKWKVTTEARFETSVLLFSGCSIDYDSIITRLNQNSTGGKIHSMSLCPIFCVIIIMFRLSSISLWHIVVNQVEPPFSDTSIPY